MRTFSRTLCPRSTLFQGLLIITILALAACAREAELPETPETRPDSTRPEQEAPPKPDSMTFAPTGAMESLAMDATARRRDLGDIRQPYPHPPDWHVDRDNFAHFSDNPVKRAVEHPVSTFSIDVDTASYAVTRRMLQAGRLPPPDAVRVEELINYFDYDYPVPDAGGEAFSVITEQAVTPWNPDTRLLKVGIKGYQPPPEEIPPANLVFLIDVSGSMAPAERLPLLQTALKMLVKQLGADDRVAIVAYAGGSGVVLESTPGDRHAKIGAAIDGLGAGGSTNGGAGIQLAYAQARQGYIADGINRVILATDGDFNVGTVDFESLKHMASQQRESGVSLTTLGVGMGNFNDHLMEQLAAAGNGNYYYLDTLGEAQKVLVDELSATMQIIASDVKIQLEFNPEVVAEYRLIGYENRQLAREDFNNDQVDAGDVGAGHTVTALYELALAGGGGERIEPLRYGDAAAQASGNGELGYLKLRYKAPGEDSSRLIEQPIAVADANAQSPGDGLMFSAAVAAFGQHLRGGKYLEGFDLAAIHELAGGARGNDAYGHRGEFLQLVRLAESFQVASVD